MTTINLIIFGIGNVGSTLINQIEAFITKSKFDKKLDIKIPIITNSKLAFFRDNLSNQWQLDFETFSEPYTIDDILQYIRSKHLTNVIVVDATASEDFVQHYPTFIENNCHIVAANKAANSLDFEFYKTIRQLLLRQDMQFYYETNVGAALPILETINRLQQSGERIHKIRGVFSGSLSYIFNRYSVEEIDFSQILEKAAATGLTEPDARDDLSGKDVARKVLILARELGLQKNINAIKVESLVPKTLNGKTTIHQFKQRITELNPVLMDKKLKKSPDEVLRYVGELDIESQHMSVGLISESKDTPLGQLKGTDNLFEIYTENYKENPLVIQGAGAGKEVTARGLLTDILKIAQTLS